jgi:hypothetical protein
LLRRLLCGGRLLLSISAAAPIAARNTTLLHPERRRRKSGRGVAERSGTFAKLIAGRRARLLERFAKGSGAY